MSNSCQGCAHQANCENVGADQCPSDVKKEESLFGKRNHIKNVIAVMSGKGGVGKSSVSALLAVALNKTGARVGVIDADITGPSQGKAFGFHHPKMMGNEYGIIPAVTANGIKVMSINFFLPNEDDPVIWRGPMMGSIINQFWNETDWQDIDYMIVDLPPGTSDIPLTIMQTLPITGALIISTPQDLVSMVVKKCVKMVQKMNAPVIGLIENMSWLKCENCGEKIEVFGKSKGENTAKEMDIPYLGGLPWDVNLNQLMDAGLIEEYNTDVIDEIVKAIMLRVG